MSRLLINCVVFALGVMLAFVFAMRGRLLSFAHNSGQQRAVVSVDTLRMPSSLDRSKARLLYAKQRRSLLQTEISLEERLAILARALDEGTAESLELLRKEHLRVIPDYRRRLLPRLRYLALESLFRRFSDADWRSWPVGALTVEGERTDARYFVDQVVAINSEIGRSLETASHLLHGMYVSISAGTPYAMKEDLQYLVLNANEVFGARSDAKTPIEPAFDPMILKDPAVNLSFEQVRAELTKQFVREHPKQVEAKVALILDLDERAADSVIVDELRKTLHVLSLHASAQFRAELLPSLVDSEMLVMLAKREGGLARALANLYVVGVIDALDAGRTTLAQKLLVRSEGTYSGLRAQKLLRSYFAQQEPEEVDEPMEIETAAGASTEAERPVARQSSRRAPLIETEQAAPDSPVKRVKAASVERGAADVKQSSSFSFGGVFLVILLLVGAGFGVRYFIAYLNRQNEEFGGNSLPAPFEPDTTPEESSVTDPSSLEFDMDDSDPDIDFGFGEADEQIANR